MSLALAHLYVPGDNEKMVTGARNQGADSLIFDLEDSVHPSRKAVARELLREVLVEADRTIDIWVRVNPVSAQSGQILQDDLASIGDLPITGILLAKTDSVQEIEAIDTMLERIERDHRLVRKMPLVPVIESASGLVGCEQIARHERVVRLQLGEADLAADLGLNISDDEMELIAHRSRVVVASAAAQIAPPTGSVYTNLSDTEGLRRSSERLRRLGFVGRTVIHPSQIPIVHAAFGLSKEHLDAARRLVDMFEQAVRNGESGAVVIDGRMVDEAVVRSACRTLGLPS